MIHTQHIYIFTCDTEAEYDQIKSMLTDQNHPFIEEKEILKITCDMEHTHE